YHSIFNRCGLKFYQVESDPGMMGGAGAHEFMAPSPVGEDTVVLCRECGYFANTELARSTPHSHHIEEEWKLEDVSTPQKRTVAEVSGFLKISPQFFIKSLLFVGKDGPFLALVRGDQELHEKKLHKIAGDFRTAEKAEIKEMIGVGAGFIGPHGNNLRKIADISLKEGVYISGANKEGFHTKGIRPHVHFDAEWHDIHMAKQGDRCPKCGKDIEVEKMIEIGNIFKLGTKYSEPLKAVYLDESGKETPIIMGSYGIGPARIAAAAVEQNHDKDGIIWPQSISPYDVEVIPLNMEDADVRNTAEILYQELRDSGIEALLDDRDARPGIKFKDADLIGIPWQVIIGKKTLQEDFVELKSRRTKETDKIAPSDVAEKITELLSN
ncbi:MAG: proline--tRNA ligase, partial [Nitrospirota bacterium]